MEGGVLTDVKQRFFRELKIVRTKKDHPCEVCSKPIQKGERVFVESGKLRFEGFFCCYFHTDEGNKCFLDYLDAVQPSNSQEILEKIRNQTFVGQISYDYWKETIYS